MLRALVCLILFFTSVAFAQIPMQDISNIKAATKLKGEWGFAHQKALLPSQTKDITQTIFLPQYLENLPSGPIGVATFVLDLKTTPNKPLDVDLNPLVNAWKLFANDELVCESGYIDPENKIYLASPIRKIATFVPKTDKTRLTLWVANSQHRHFGIGVSPQIAPTGVFDVLHRSWANFDLALVSILLVTGLYHLGLFAVWRRDKAPLWFGLFLLVFAVRVASTGEKLVTLMFEGATWEMVTRAEYISGYLTIPLFILYIGSLYQNQSIKIIERINVWVGAFLVLSAIFTSSMFFTSIMPLAEVVIIQSVVVVSFVLYRAFKDKEPNSVFAFGAFVIFAASIVHDVLMFAKFIDATQDFGPIGLVFYLFAQAYILLQRYANAFHEVQKHEDELEMTVAKRTSELKEMLSQRELLMRELSHRVKNNLQFIIVLLWNKRIKADEDTKKILLSLESQIQAVATVHETLCTQPNIASLDGGEHVGTLVEALKNLYPDVNFVCTIGNKGELCMDDAISLGLVVSELVSNSIKHALVNLSGVVQIGFEVENNIARFSYSDGRTNFEGSSFTDVTRSGKSIGWSMIMKLVYKLKARTEAKGTLFSIVFDVDKAP
jgi:two-component sensor histidine kinase